MQAPRQSVLTELRGRAIDRTETLCFLVDNIRRSGYSPACDFNLITVTKTCAWAGTKDAYRIDVTYQGKSVLCVDDVAARVEALDGLRQRMKGRAIAASIARHGLMKRSEDVMSPPEPAWRTELEGGERDDVESG